jgi:hypothetical protein
MKQSQRDINSYLRVIDTSSHQATQGGRPSAKAAACAGYQVVEGHLLEGVAAVLLSTCMDKRIETYGRRKEYDDTSNAFHVNEQVSGSERAGVREGETQ